MSHQLTHLPVKPTSIIVLISFLSGLMSCHANHATPMAVRIDFDQLPTVGSGSDVRICGWFEAAYETCSLTASKDAAMFPGSRHIWVIPRTDTCSPNKVIEHPVGAWAEVTGRLNPGEGQGHLGTYTYALSNAVVELRGESCK
jgi:hypothetical protein